MAKKKRKDVNANHADSVIGVDTIDIDYELDHSCSLSTGNVRGNYRNSALIEHTLPSSIY